MKPYKSCACRHPETGKQYGEKKCPQLDGRRHGKWYARYEVPSLGGKRRRPRIGPYDTESECRAALAKAVSRAQAGFAADEKITVGEYLARRLEWRRSESGPEGGLATSTLDAEKEAIELYFTPGLGYLRMVALRDHHIRDLYAAMRLINRPEEKDPPDGLAELLSRLLAARAARETGRASTRPLSEARIRRVHAVLTGALNDAAKKSKILEVSPATGVFSAKGTGRKRKVKPLLWTPERTATWERAGKIPGKVMVWTPTQCGGFLDFAVADRLYALWHLAAFWGLRRGEIIGLEWDDVGLDTRRLHVRQAQPGDELGDVKSEESDRIVTFDEHTAFLLRAWHKRQAAERLAAGEGWVDSGRVFTMEDGRALGRGYLTVKFRTMVTRYQVLRCRSAEGWEAERIARHHRTELGAVRVALAGPVLPPVRLHDLRHGAATMLHAAGVSMKVISEILGHASEAFTSDVYAVVADELAEDAAAKIADFVPRRKRA